MDLDKEFALSKDRLAMRLDADVKAAERRIEQPTPTEIAEALEAMAALGKTVSKWLNAFSAGFAAFGKAYANKMKEDHAGH
ncbi:MAG: hypothetical protein ACTIJ6_05415 [Leucobacter sp.]